MNKSCALLSCADTLVIPFVLRTLALSGELVTLALLEHEAKKVSKNTMGIYLKKCFIIYNLISE